MITKLVSGGQTGADRAALDVAIRHGFPHGGWCPTGRKAEDGEIRQQYILNETPSARYLERTEWNVRDTDGTVVFTMARVPSGGSLRTIEFANQYKKPCLHIFRGLSYAPDQNLREFVQEHGIKILNVAGSRESKEPGVYRWVYDVLEMAFCWEKMHPSLLGGPGEG